VFFRRTPAVSYDWVISGLGNPGGKYAGTRHNLGFWVIDALTEKWGAGRRYRKFSGELRSAKFAGANVLLVKPMTFMNGSGLCIGPLMRRHKDAKLLVVFDDVSLALGKLRMRLGGSAGGHKGVASIIRRHGEDFHRLKLGIGGGELDYLTDWVLDEFEPEERPVALDMIAKAVKKIEEIIADGWERAMTTGFSGEPVVSKEEGDGDAQ